ncbi:MAG: FHA domain-containing serine/threonine-protein kinase [Planctomycetota bacterium]
MPRLIVDKGADRGRSVPLEEGCKVIFGRDESCEFVIADASASRRHFAIIEQNGSYFVKDLKSTHGTLVNGWAIETAKLEDGDAIRVGETVLSFVAESGESGRGLSGKVIAGYQVQERLGRGGMGTVFRAKQIALDRDVALKVLSARYSDDKTFINRFFKEAQAAARLNHPNIVQIYDVREEKGLYLISMEMMDSGTVEELVQKEGPLPISKVMMIAKDAAQGLVYAERKGIVHRDIKPDNLMLNSDGHVKISDLGLAHDSSGDRGAHGDEGIFGTPHFIAPEQARGQEIDSRADIYSLGASLYRLLSGRTPFSGDSVGEIIKKQINDEPEPLRELRPETPEDLVDLISVMMAKAPEDRFENAESLLEAVTSLGTTGKIGGAGLSPALKYGGLAVAIALIGGAAWFFSRPQEKPIVAPISNGGDSNGNNGNGGDSAAAAKLERQQLEIKLKGEYLAARNFELELKRNGNDQNPEMLDDLALKFTAAAKVFPEHEEAIAAKADAVRVSGQAAKIREQRQLDAEARAERDRQLEASWQSLESSITTARDADQFAKAMGLCLGGAEAMRGSKFEATLKTLRSDLLSTAAARAQSVRSDARAQVDDRAFDEARAILREAIATWSVDMQVGAGYEAIAAHVIGAQGDLEQIEELERAKIAADRKHDKTLVYGSLHAFRMDLKKSMNYEPMRLSLTSTRSMLKAGLGAKRLDRALEGLNRLAEARQFLIEYINANPGKPLKVSSTAQVLPKGSVIKADANGFDVERRKGKVKRVAWKTADFAEVHRYLLKRAAKSPKDWVKVGWACVESGFLPEAEKALTEFADKNVGDQAASAANLKTEFARENAASQKLAEIGRLYKEARAGNKQSWFPLHRELREFVRDYWDTRVMAVVSDGEFFFRDPRNG